MMAHSFLLKMILLERDAKGTKQNLASIFSYTKPFNLLVMILVFFLFRFTYRFPYVAVWKLNANLREREREREREIEADTQTDRETKFLAFLFYAIP